MQLTDLQRRALAVPPNFDLVLPGGRNSSKTTAVYALTKQHADAFGEQARIGFTRRTYPALRPAFEDCQQVLAALGSRFAANKAELTLRFDNGAQLSFIPLADEAYYRERWQGMNLTLLAADEMSAHFTPRLLDLARSNLRHATIPTRFIGATNPGPGGPWISARWIEPSQGLQFGEPFTCDDTGRPTVVLHSTLADNPYAGEQAEQNIRAAAAGNEALYRMYRYGIFGLLEGAFFSLREANYISLPQFEPADYQNWRFESGLDHGSRAPYHYSLTMRALDDAMAPDGTYYPQGSSIVFAEAHSADPQTGFTTAARTVTVADIAGDIITLCERHRLRPPATVSDDQVYQDHGHDANLAAEYRGYGIPVQRAYKGRRIPSLQKLREMLTNAASPGDRIAPGCYIDRDAAPYLTTALESAPADERMPEDIQLGYALQHPIDSIRYLLNARTGPQVIVENNIFTTGGASHLDRLERQWKYVLKRDLKRKYAVGRCRVNRH